MRSPPKGAVTGADALAILKSIPLIVYTKRHHMGRVLADHLARQNLTLAHRYELDSYHAILAMVASGAGWTISLSARRGVLGELPGIIAAQLRVLVQEQVVTPGQQRMPWLGDQLRLL